MNERLVLARTMRHIKSKAEAARRMGIGGSTYSAHENGQNDFGPADAERYGEFYGVRAAWLLTGELPMKADGDRSVISFDDAERVSMPGGSASAASDGVAYRSRLPDAVPQIDAEAGAGLGTVGEVITIESAGIMSGHAVTAEWVIPRQYLGVNPSRIILLPVIGTSMVPMLNAGDVVAVDTHSRVVRSGEIYVLDEGEGPIVKRLRLDKDTDPVMIEISSDNPGVPNYRRPAELVRVLGRVVARWSKM